MIFVGFSKVRRPLRPPRRGSLQAESEAFRRALQAGFRQIFGRAFGSKQGAVSPALVSAHTGFPTGEILKQEICCLNKSLILTPVDHLLVKEEPLVLQELLALDSSSSLTSAQQVEEPKTKAIYIMEPNPVRPLDNNGTLDEEMLPTTRG